MTVHPGDLRRSMPVAHGLRLALACFSLACPKNAKNLNHPNHVPALKLKCWSESPTHSVGECRRNITTPRVDNSEKFELALF